MYWSLLLLRLASVVVVQTFFVPDEFWQSLEVAHGIVYGYGYRTWEWRHCIRSYLTPAVIAALYWLLKVTGLDSRQALIYTPRLLQALLTWLGDEAILATVRKFYGSSPPSPSSSSSPSSSLSHRSKLSSAPARVFGLLWASPTSASDTVALCLLTNWCLFYCGSRTLANTLEMALVSIALYMYPWQRRIRVVDSRYLLLAALACTARPTAAILFLPLWLGHMWRSLPHCRMELLWKSLLLGFVAICTCVALDSYMHGALCVSVYNFALYNTVYSVAQQYGREPWYQYLVVWCPLLLGPLLVPPLLYLTCSKGRQVLRSVLLAWPGAMLTTLVVSYITVYSLLDHKEFRFLLPILPAAIVLLGKLLHELKCDVRWYRFVTISSLLYNIPLAIYLSCVHQRAPIAIMDSIYQHSLVTPLAHRGRSVLFLTPCHSTPLYSHLHLNVSIRFLTCEPNLNGPPEYEEEYSTFEKNPVEWLRTEYRDLLATPTNITSFHVDAPDWSVVESPSLIVAFDWLWRDVLRPVIGWRYYVCADWLNTHFVYDSRRSSRLLLLCDKNN